MKITFLLPGNVCSGGTRVTAQMGNVLLQRGHEVRVAYRRRPRLSSSEVLNSLRTIKYFCTGVRETLWLDTFAGPRQSFFRLADLRFAPGEVVIAVGNDSIAELLALQADVVKVQYCHGFIEQNEAVRRWKNRLPTLTVSQRLAEELQASCDAHIAGVVPNGISPQEYFIENRERDGIGFIHHGSALKGGEVSGALIDALHREFPEYHCRAFGSYPRPEGLQTAHYSRYPSIDKAREIYNRCRIWLVTSRNEGFCLPILEAMACGCAVISSRHQHSAQLIQPGVNGLVVEYGDVEAYLNGIRTLLHDDALRQKFVANGMETVRRFTWDAAAGLMEQALEAARPAVISTSNGIQAHLELA